MLVSINKSVRTCRVDQGHASRMQSDRFLNSEKMVCVPWNGTDSTGRYVSRNSWWTKTPGCNSSSDRVLVENELRPQYAEYINLNAGAGINGGIYGNDTAKVETKEAACFEQSRNNYTGNYGKQFQAQVKPTCYSDMGDDVMASRQRGKQYKQQGWHAEQRRRCQ
jgi:hypothetical protein